MWLLDTLFLKNWSSKVLKKCEFLFDPKKFIAKGKIWNSLSKAYKKTIHYKSCILFTLSCLKEIYKEYFKWEFRTFNCNFILLKYTYLRFLIIQRDP